MQLSGKNYLDMQKKRIELAGSLRNLDVSLDRKGTQLRGQTIEVIPKVEDPNLWSAAILGEHDPEPVALEDNPPAIRRGIFQNFHRAGKVWIKQPTGPTYYSIEVADIKSLKVLNQAPS